jgi:hypothetical protein
MSVKDRVNQLRKPRVTVAQAPAKPANQPAQSQPQGTLSTATDAALERLRRENAELRLRAEEEVAKAREENERLRASLKQRDEETKRAKIRDALRATVRSAGAVDEDDATDLLLARHSFDLGSDGAVLVAGKPNVKLDAFVAETLGAKAHLMKPKTQPGGGASPFPTAPTPSQVPTDRTSQLRAGLLRIAQGDQAPPAAPQDGQGAHR